MALGKSQLTRLYRKRARFYDWSAQLYYLIGFREWAYRKKAVRALRLRPGATVVEIGCGTGLNFRLLRNEVGSTGRVIGVDMADAMLVKARERVDAREWHNVELVRSDAASYPFPDGLDGILSTFALTLVPEYEEIIARGARSHLRIYRDDDLVIAILTNQRQTTLTSAALNLTAGDAHPIGTLSTVIAGVIFNPPPP